MSASNFASSTSANENKASTEETDAFSSCGPIFLQYVTKNCHRRASLDVEHPIKASVCFDRRSSIGTLRSLNLSRRLSLGEEGLKLRPSGSSSSINEARLRRRSLDTCPGVYDPRRRSSLGAESLIEYDLEEENESSPDLRTDIPSDALLGLQYADDVFAVKRDLEVKYHPRKCLESQPQVTEPVRCATVNWLVKINRKLKFGAETVFLAVHLLDRFLAASAIASDCVQLLAVCSLFVAAKMEEIKVPGMSAFVRFCSTPYQKHHFRRMEILLLTKLGFYLHAPSSWYFINHLALKACQLGYLDRRVTRVARRVAELCLCQYRISQYLPSVQAVASFLSAVAILEPELGETLTSLLEDKDEGLGNALPGSEERNVQGEGSRSGRSTFEEPGLLVDHSQVNNFEAVPADGDTFDVWAHAMRLDDPGALSSSDDSSSLPGRVQNNTEIVAQVGGTATLSCFTGHMSDETVTWLKREDDQLLTVGQLVYVAEERLKVSQCHRTKAWELFIKDVHESDAGQYECQLTTHPPVSYFFSLRVTQAVAEVIGSKEVHIEEGSQLALECQVLRAPVPPIYIFWYHNGTMVNYNQNLIVRTENFTSSLVVSKVTGRDAGIYTCEPQLASPANVTVHVVTGERPAAMQHGHSSSAFIISPAHHSLLVVLCFALGYISLWHSSSEEKQAFKLQASHRSVSCNGSDGVTCRSLPMLQAKTVKSDCIKNASFSKHSSSIILGAEKGVNRGFENNLTMP